MAAIVVSNAREEVHRHILGCWNCCFLAGAAVTWMCLFCESLLNYMYYLHIDVLSCM